MTTIRVAGAQIDLTVGDLSGNEERILEAMMWAEKVEADILVVPELAVVGYPKNRFLAAAPMPRTPLERRSHVEGSGIGL